MSKRDRDRNHGNYAAPWKERHPGAGGEFGPEYNPISARTGRAVAQSTAERDWAEGFQSVPTEGHDAGGMWDYDEERRCRGRMADGSSVPVRAKPILERYDAAAMRAFVERAGATLTAHEWEIYTYFWVQRLSYRVIAAKLGRNEDKVYQAIKRLRVKLAGATGSGPRYQPKG